MKPVALGQKRYREIIKYQSKRNRKKDRLVVVSGERLMEQLAEKNVFPIEVFAVEKRQKYLSMYAKCKAFYSVNESQMKRITDVVTPQKIAGLYFTGRHNQETTDRYVYLDNISDPGNLGTILRTACAFDLPVLISENCAELFNPKVIRSSMGAALYHSIKTVKLSEFKADHKIYLADMNGTNMNDVKVADDKWILVIGSEAHGLSDSVRELGDEIVSIPMGDSMESLNASVAAGILINRFVAK